MLIISKFHDYYDTAMIHGIDKECVYNRETKEIELDNFKDVKLPYSREWTFNSMIKMTAEPFLIGFCGKIYPMIKVSFSNNGYPLDAPLEKPYYFYDSQSYIDFITSRTIMGIGKKRLFDWYGRGSIDSENGSRNFFNENYSKLEKYFLEYKVPVFVFDDNFRKTKLILNPKLMDYYFVCMMDPATTFQEIYMYQAGVLGNKEKEITNISDKDKIQQHGFDKHSFRTMKGDKKPRAKNRGKL